MNNSSIAPCGVNCDICMGFQRSKNKCVGCNNSGDKPYHCTVCSIKYCAEKSGDEILLCANCVKFPCRRIKNLDKRYVSKYGLSLIDNLRKVIEIGLSAFVESEALKWKCQTCGNLLCVHNAVCLNCGNVNQYFLTKPLK